MKVLIAYFSMTGNTYKIASAIRDQVVSQGHDVDMSRIGDVAAADLEAHDLVFLGSACHDADLALPAKDVLEGIAKASTFKLAGFVTHATIMPDGGARADALYERWASRCDETFLQASREKGIDFLGYYHCQGAASAGIEAFIRQTIITEEDEWEGYVQELRRRPDERDVQEAKDFAAQVLAKC